jgi:hypothetical protein
MRSGRCVRRWERNWRRHSRTWQRNDRQTKAHACTLPAKWKSSVAKRSLRRSGIAPQRSALLEIDRERSATAKFQKELDGVRAEATRVSEQHRLETYALQQQLGDTRQYVGPLSSHR